MLSRAAEARILFLSCYRFLRSELDPDNRVVSVLAPASTSGLRVGDFILEVDGHALGSDMLVSVLEKNGLKGPDHELRIRREKELAA